MDDKNRRKQARKTKKALSRLRRTLRKKETLEGDAAFSEWEDEFTSSLEQRLEKYGAAFADPQKGERDEALSYRQAAKLREIEKKAVGKARKPMQRNGFKRKKLPEKESARQSWSKTARSAQPAQSPPPAPPSGPPKLKLIPGGKADI